MSLRTMEIFRSWGLEPAIRPVLVDPAAVALRTWHSAARNPRAIMKLGA